MMFNIAGLNIRISFAGNRFGFNLLPSFRNFAVREANDNGLLLDFVVDDSLTFPDAIKGKFCKDVETGNGIISVERFEDDSYLFDIHDITGELCCRLMAGRAFRHCRCALYGSRISQSFGLNTALMLAFAFAGSFKQAILLHASLVRRNGYGYAFIAKSGTGKSTHTALWMENLPDCDLINDDNPVLRIVNGRVWLYGSPWSGKTPCYRNVGVPLGAITKIVRDNANFITELSSLEAFSSMLSAVSTMKWDVDIHDNVCGVIKTVIESGRVYALHCLPDKEAAIVCSKAICVR